MADDATNVLVNSATKTQTDQDKISLLGKADDVIGILANYFGVLGIPGAAQIFAALKLALEKPTPSPEMDILQHIAAQISDLVNQTGIQDSANKMLSLVPLTATVEADLEILMIEGPTGPHVDEKGFFEHALTLIDALLNEVYWYRGLVLERVFTPADLGGAVGIAWFGDYSSPDPPYRVIPPLDTTLVEGYTAVFDPQLALPIYVKAIEMFLAINALLDPGGFGTFLEQWRGVIKSFADFLQNIYDGAGRTDTLVKGLVLSDVPTPDEVFDYIEAYKASKFGFEWNGIYGVIDLYGVYTAADNIPSRSASHMIDVFTTADILNVPSVPRNDDWYVACLYPWVRDRVVLGRMARRKAVYLLRGYDKAWSVIQKLRVLTSEQTGESNDENKNWSARELIGTLGLPRSSSDQVPGGNTNDYSLSDLVERLDQLAKGTWDNPPAPWFIVLSERPFGLTYDPSNRPIRFRERLAAAAL